MAAKNQVCQKGVLPLEWIELGKMLESLPANQRIMRLFAEAERAVECQARLLSIGRNGIEDLILYVKYLEFDRDATRQERDEAREEVNDWRDWYDQNE